MNKKFYITLSMLLENITILAHTLTVTVRKIDYHNIMLIRFQFLYNGCTGIYVVVANNDNL